MDDHDLRASTIFEITHLIACSTSLQHLSNRDDPLVRGDGP